jgi:hypothetical protein
MGENRGEMNMEYDESQISGYSITEIRGYLEKNKEEYLNRFRIGLSTVF